MGFDLFAHDPLDKSNDYFRANIWSWPGILELIAETGVMSDDALTSMSFNDGYSVSGEEAERIADEMDVLVEKMNDDNYIIPEELNEVAAQMYAVVNGFVEKMGQEGVEITPERPMYSTQVAHIREFIRFARNSGGFDVY